MSLRFYPSYDVTRGGPDIHINGQVLKASDEEAEDFALNLLYLIRSARETRQSRDGLIEKIRKVGGL